MTLNAAHESPDCDADAAPTPWWFNPAVFILVPVATSFTVWALVVISGVLPRFPPAIGTKLMGFVTPAPVSVAGVVLLATFYGFLVWMAMLGWAVGGAAADRVAARRPAPEISERRYFYLVLAVAAVGVGFCYATVASRRSIIGALSSQTGNQLYDSLPQNAGVQTLRYACILAAPLGVYLWRKGAVGFPAMAVAVTLLCLNALLSSRLSLIMASTVYLTIWVRTRKPRRPNGPRYGRVVLAALGIGFLMLTGLNYSRNANFYRDAGVTDPITMNLYQTSQYLTVPAQVSFGVADYVMSGKWHVPSEPLSSANAVLPTFLQKNKVRKADKRKFSADYGYSSSFSPQYFTNSAFADIYEDFGAWGWFYSFILYGIAGFAMARFMRGVPVVAATAGVFAYCFAEVWRIQIPNYGFVIFLAILTIGGSWLARVKETR